LPCAEQVAHHIHAVHQGAFDHVQRPAALGAQRLPHQLGVFGDEFIEPVHQRVGQALAQRQLAPLVFLAVVLGPAFGRFGNFDEALAGGQSGWSGGQTGVRLSTTSSTRSRSTGSISS
jgi:hypothetical protein